jgi:hypothetical protein
MRHWLGSGWRVSAALILLFCLVILAGCGGGGGNPNAVGNVASVTITPSAISLNNGDVLSLNVSALDANKKSVFNQTFSFSSSNPAIQVSTTGLLCAGTWLNANNVPSLTNPINCKPIAFASPAAAAAGVQSNIHATVQGINSNSVVVSVHEAITSISITPSAPACVSQTGTVGYTAHAFNGATDITASVGAFSWNISNSTVGSLSSFFTSGSTATTNTATAKLPGVVQVTVAANTVNPVSGVPATFTECAVAAISITPAPITTLTAAGKTQQLTATVTDSLGATVTGETLTWSSSQPASVGISTSGLATAVAAGTSNIIASCAPSSCNLGFNQPVYSNVALATVPGSAPATTVYATCGGAQAASATPVDACASGLSPAFPLVPISTSTNTAGTGIALAEQPLSLNISNAGDKLYVGGTTRLAIIDTATNTISSQVTNADLWRTLPVRECPSFRLATMPLRLARAARPRW